MTNLDSIFKSRAPTKVHLVKAMVFPVVMYGCESWTVKKASAKELMLLNCGIGEDPWESLGLQADPTSPFLRRSALGFLWREWCWSWNSITLATSCEELTHWKRLWCWEGLGAGEGTTEDEMVGWHHWLNGRESEWTLGVGDGQRDLASCSPCGHKGSDMTEQLNWTELNWTETNCQVIREVEVESCGHEMCWHKSWIKLPFSPMIVHPELLINIFRVAEMSLPLTI